MFDLTEDVASGTGRAPRYEREGAAAEIAIVNTAVSSVVTYVSKYVMKSAADDRTAAWRSCWGVRGVQWFGIRNSLSVWRELRRIGEKRMVGQGVDRALWNAARAREVAKFLRLLGGLAASPCTLICRARGLWTASKKGKYGETGGRLVGVVVEAVGTVIKLVSRTQSWKLVTSWPKKTNKINDGTVNQSYPSIPARRFYCEISST